MIVFPLCRPVWKAATASSRVETPRKVPGRMPCPLYYAASELSKRGGTGITDRRLTSRSHGGANRQRRHTLFAALPGAAPGVFPHPRISENRSGLSGTAPCALPEPLRPAPTVHPLQCACTPAEQSGVVPSSTKQTAFSQTDKAPMPSPGRRTRRPSQEGRPLQSTRAGSGYR